MDCMNARHAIVDAKKHASVFSCNLNLLGGLDFFGFRMVACTVTTMTAETLDDLTEGNSSKKRKANANEQRPKSTGRG